LASTGVPTGVGEPSDQLQLGGKSITLGGLKGYLEQMVSDKIDKAMEEAKKQVRLKMNSNNLSKIQLFNYI